MDLPFYDLLIRNYPPSSKVPSEKLFRTIGGGANSEWIVNTCVLRMSYAFNYIGLKALSISSYMMVDPFNQKKQVESKSTTPTSADYVTSYDLVNRQHNLPATYPTKFETTNGKDGKRYLFRVDEFYYYLNSKYKKADISVGHAINDNIKKTLSYEEGRLFRDRILGKRGIICFFITFSDATGHFTFWNGYECVDGSDEYFFNPRLYGLYFWTC